MSQGLTNTSLPPGTNLIGKVGTDQTTHGTTDLVAADITKVGGSAVTTALPVGGDVAHGSTDSGNPVKIGGFSSTNLPTLVTAGQRVNAAFDRGGQLYTCLQNQNTVSDGNSNAIAVLNGVNAAGTVLPVIPLYHNNSTRDLPRNNHEVTGLTSSARTASVNSSDLTNYNARGVVVTVDITANSSAAGITVVIKYKDTLSGKYVALLTSATLGVATATGTTSLVVYPGTTISANLDANSPLPRLWRIEVTNGDASSITYSISANYVM